MNEVMKNILTRRSIKSYTEEMVSKELIEQIVEAGKYAPSALNRQPWKIVVIQNPDILEDIANTSSFNGMDPLHGARTLIAVFCEKERASRVNDGTLVMSNMLLATHSLGLGGSWIGSTKEYFFKKPGHKIMEDIGISQYECIGTMIVGYINGEPPTASERAKNTVIFLD